jgi:hypothetical protein
MEETQKQIKADDNVLLLRQLEEVEGCGQDGHIVLECGSGKCWFPNEADRLTE